MAIEPLGSRVTAVAERTRMSKQAVGELIRYLSDRGYLVVESDPADRRAKLVRLTERGWGAIETGEQVIDEFDAWLEDTIGGDQVSQLRNALTRIADTTLDTAPRSAPSSA